MLILEQTKNNCSKFTHIVKQRGKTPCFLNQFNKMILKS